MFWSGCAWDDPRFVPGTNPVCPRDKPRLSQGQTEVFSLFYTVGAQFVPGTNPVCPRDKPVANGSRKSLCANVYVPFLAPNYMQLFLFSGINF